MGGPCYRFVLPCLPRSSYRRSARVKRHPGLTSSCRYYERSPTQLFSYWNGAAITLSFPLRQRPTSRLPLHHVVGEENFTPLVADVASPTPNPIFQIVGDIHPCFPYFCLPCAVPSRVQGYRAVLMRMPRALNTFILDNTACFRNELLMCNTLLKHNPTFDR